ncbi:glycosyltransferase family 4 protein [Desulforamulus ruminis]|uniref:Glycosyl transferase group 1 n=1 Tax=Desulforamulus ruminis (strain ATCC 23193 / DSM 2154 / NCIMB 8452 / DL) TaxID=696281 RepID=F6DP42_DESRL|nr:glycosyltransferase family 1 protein [Desulforamulus ruminis]AEG61871.1 glycosyl transferase group 1 [Desulforamulus ruminis DSM 2154]
MRVVLATEAIKQPLTGIGRYTWELASRLLEHPSVHSIRYLSQGRWKNSKEVLGCGTSKGKGGNGKKQKEGVFYQQLVRSKAVGNVYDLLYPFLVKARVNSKETDLFHGPNYLVPKLDIPTVVTIHDLSTIVNPKWHLPQRAARINKSIIRSLKNASQIITDSQAIRKEVLTYFGLPEDRVAAIHLGVDSVFRPRTFANLQVPLGQFGLKPGSYSLCVATIEPRKNIMRLISAYRELPAQIRCQWPLVLVGERGWNSQEIHQEIIRAAQEGWLKYLGYIPQGLLPLLYAGCRLFAYPSLYEGFGLPIAEAMASGVPVLTSNRSSMPEVAGGASLLIEPEDEIALREGLSLALQDEGWRSRAVEEGLRHALEMTWDACIEKTIAVYDRAIRQ